MSMPTRMARRIHMWAYIPTRRVINEEAVA